MKVKCNKSKSGAPDKKISKKLKSGMPKFEKKSKTEKIKSPKFNKGKSKAADVNKLKQNKNKIKNLMENSPKKMKTDTQNVKSPKHSTDKSKSRINEDTNTKVCTQCIVLIFLTKAFGGGGAYVPLE